MAEWYTRESQKLVSQKLVWVRLPLSAHMYYTYVLRSTVDKKMYIGWTNDLKKRLITHNTGLVESTKYIKPLELIYYEACLSEERAVKREKQLKTGFGRLYLKNRI